MKRLAMLAAVLLGSCSSAQAYWFWPLPNPQLSSWYSTYTTVYQGHVVMTTGPGTKGQAMYDLRQIIHDYPTTQHRVVQVATTGNVMVDYRDSWNGPFGPGDEALMLLEMLGGSAP